MTGFDPHAFAARLLSARRLSAQRLSAQCRGGLASLAGGPATYDEGLAAARALAGLQGADPPAGFKIGATAGRMRAYLGVDEPIAGAMAAEGLHGSGSVLSFASFLHVGVECELAVVLARDLPGPCTAAQAADACGELMTSIELVENRYGNVKVSPPLLVADAMFHAACVLGEPGPHWRELDLRLLEGALSVDGEERGRGLGADLLGDPMEALAWLAGSREASAFGGLRAGQVVTLGSVTTPVWLEGPCTVSVAFPPLAPVVLTLV